MQLADGTRAFILAARVARLATVDAQSRPHVVPVCFALADDVVYSVIDQKPKRTEPAGLRRLRNIATNTNVQILFDRYDDADWSRLRFVQVRGQARVIVSGREYDGALAALRARYDQYVDMELHGRPVIAIDIDGVVTWPKDGAR